MNGLNTDYPLHSVSEISKRTYGIGISTLGIGSMLFVFLFWARLYSIAVLVACFCVGISIILFLHNKKIISNTKLPLVTFVCIWLVLFAANDGYQTGQYVYFFPLMIAIPVIVDNQKTHYKKVVLYFIISTISCVICFCVGKYHQPWHVISVDNQNMLFATNMFCAIGATISFAYINVDLERKYLKELIDQKNETIVSRTQFLSTMGHELRTPLNGIIGAINLLKKGENLPEQQEYFDILKYCSDHMLLQINDILDFNKIQAGKLEIHPLKVNLKTLLDNSTIPFANQFEEKGLELISEIDSELDAFVLVDDVRLIQVLNNLLSNAGKFTSAGYVKMAAKCLSKTETNLKVRFWVEDTGRGIEPKDQQLIFESFGQVYEESTRKFTGSGLGLNICLQILKLMNSSLELKSTRDVGSVFSFTINFEQLKGDNQAEFDAYAEQGDLEGIKILLVEDNKINMVIAKKILADFKADCKLAYNGLEALEILKDNHDFNIILLDLEMPVMDGYDAITQVKVLYPNIPVLAFTATLMDLNMLEKIKSMGFLDYVLKPFQPSILCSQIKKHALKSSSGPQPVLQ